MDAVLPQPGATHEHTQAAINRRRMVQVSTRAALKLKRFSGCIERLRAPKFSFRFLGRALSMATLGWASSRKTPERRKTASLDRVTEDDVNGPQR